MHEQLIDEIMTEVLRRLKNENQLSFVKKKNLLVLSESSYPLSEKIANEYNVTQKDLTSVKDDVELKPLLSYSDLILVTSLDVEQLVDIAIGNGEGQLVKAIRYALLLGKPIFILEDGLIYRFYKATASKTFYRRLLEYEECIKGYGIQFTTEEMLLLSEKREINSDKDTKVLDNVKSMDIQYKDTVTLNKKLILEKDLMELNIKMHTVIHIGKNSIVTPSAQDYARAHRISFIKD